MPLKALRCLVFGLKLRAAFNAALTGAEGVRVEGTVNRLDRNLRMSIIPTNPVPLWADCFLPTRAKEVIGQLAERDLLFNCLPRRELIFRAFEIAPQDVSVCILGQDHAVTPTHMDFRSQASRQKFLPVCATFSRNSNPTFRALRQRRGI